MARHVTNCGVHALGILSPQSINGSKQPMAGPSQIHPPDDDAASGLVNDDQALSPHLKR
jgi:hypothetical protein